jgi:hypothetical protein
LLWLLCIPWSLGESTCGRVLLRALRIPRYLCKRGAHGPSLRSGSVFTFFLLCIDICRAKAGMLWVPRILFLLSPASPHAFLFGNLPLTMLLLRALNACLSFLLLILLGCTKILPSVFVFLLLCFAPVNCAPSACWCSTAVSRGLACSICAPPCSTAVYNLCSSASLLHAYGVLLEFPVSVVSVLIRSFGFAFCPVAV